MKNILPSQRSSVAHTDREITRGGEQLLDVSVDYATGHGREVRTVHGVISDQDAEDLRQTWRTARSAEDATTQVTLPVKSAYGVADIAVQVPAAAIRLIVTTPTALRRQETSPAIPPLARRPEQLVAVHDWHTAAEVEITGAVTAYNVLGEVRTFPAGERLVMHQWGRAGRPVDRDVWWTSYDVDAAYTVPTGQVHVTRILDESYPTLPAGGDL